MQNIHTWMKFGLKLLLETVSDELIVVVIVYLVGYLNVIYEY